jgi:acyl carrier protein
MDKEIELIIIELLKKIGSEKNMLSLLEIDNETKLYGREGNLDSLSLVRFAIELEEAIYEKYELSISIVDDRAMSQSSSPFKSVGTLKAYILELVETFK